jgi:hypothetical protein
VGEGLGDAPEDEGWSHPRLEHHGEPRERAELGLLAIFAEAELPVAAEGDHDDEDEEKVPR